MEVPKHLAFADVTSRGIKFIELFYTCDLAIKEQWFEKARVEGTWKVLIIFDNANLDIITLISPHNLEKITCNTIKANTASGEKLERYFNSIQQLKVRKNSESSKK